MVCAMCKYYPLYPCSLEPLGYPGTNPLQIPRDSCSRSVIYLEQRVLMSTYFMLRLLASTAVLCRRSCSSLGDLWLSWLVFDTTPLGLCMWSFFLFLSFLLLPSLYFPFPHSLSPSPFTFPFSAPIIMVLQTHFVFLLL